MRNVVLVRKKDKCKWRCRWVQRCISISRRIFAFLGSCGGCIWVI